MRSVFVTAMLIGMCAISTAASAAVQLDLKGSIRLAGQNNPAVVSAERNADAARARVSSAASAAGPNLSVRSGYGYVSKDTSFGGTPILEKNTVTESLVLEKQLYSGGRIGASIDAAKHGLAAAEESVGTSKDAVAVRVAGSYFAAKMAREDIQAAQESVKALEASRDQASKLKEAGLVTKADVLRSEVDLASAKQRQIAAENNYKIALASLKTAIGLDQSEQVELAESGDEGLPADFSKVEPKERHDIAATKAGLAALGSQVRVAQSGHKPQVYAQLDALNISKGAEFPRRSNTLALGLEVRVPIFDSGAARASVDEARAAQAKTREDLRGLVQSTELEVESARIDLSSALARLDVTATQVQSAEETLRVLQNGYREGVTPMTDVLAAQSALTEARFQRSANAYDVDVARVRLAVALGRADLLE